MAGTELKGLRVLVIDDNVDAADSLAWLLADADAEMRGAQIDGAVNGLQAMLEHVRASHGDVSTLAAKLKELEDQRAKVARQFDDAIKQLGL